MKLFDCHVVVTECIFIVASIEMKTIHCLQDVNVPKDCQVTIKSRLITVVGPRGTIKRNLKHLQIDIRLIAKVCMIIDKPLVCHERVKRMKHDYRNFYTV